MRNAFIIFLVILALALLVFGVVLRADWAAIAGAFIGGTAGLLGGGGREDKESLPPVNPGVFGDSGRGGPDSIRLAEVRASLERGASIVRQSEQDLGAIKDRIELARDSVVTGSARARGLSASLRGPKVGNDSSGGGGSGGSDIPPAGP